MLDAAARVPDVTVIEMSQYFCDAVACYPSAVDVVIYYDQQHVTTMYSRTLARPLLAAIMGAGSR